MTIEPLRVDFLENQVEVCITLWDPKNPEIHSAAGPGDLIQLLDENFDTGLKFFDGLVLALVKYNGKEWVAVLDDVNEYTTPIFGGQK